MVSSPDDDNVSALYLIRLLPVVFSAAAAIAYVFHVEGGNAYAIRNTGPIIIVVVLALIALWRGSGRWTGSGWSWLLGTCGFAIPALGLSVCLHYGYASDMNGMVSDAIYPKELFRFLPLYTIVAGTIGFAIGWIVGKNV
jgi:hypothetical protein